MCVFMSLIVMTWRLIYRWMESSATKVIIDGKLDSIRIKVDKDRGYKWNRADGLTTLNLLKSLHNLQVWFTAGKTIDHRRCPAVKRKTVSRLRLHWTINSLNAGEIVTDSIEVAACLNLGHRSPRAPVNFPQSSQRGRKVDSGFDCRCPRHGFG